MNGCNILLSLLVVNCLQQISSLQSTVGFKSILKCREYQQAEFQQPINRDAIFFPGELSSRNDVEQFEQRNETKHPFIVSLYDNQTKPVCGGVLISDRFVLTSTYCFNNHFGKEYIVGVATGYNASLATENELNKVVRSIQHPRYTEKPLYHGIGLLELEKPVRFAPDVRPACLQVPTVIADTEWYMNAWVRRNKTKVLETYSVQEVQSDECQKIYNHDIIPYGVIEHLQICVFEDVQERLFIRRNAIFVRNKGLPGYTIIGIPSVGKPGVGLPEVYDRVSYYISWIESIVWPEAPTRGCNKIRFSN